MARRLILENLMKLAQGIGANPSKFMGTRTNINFLGKGPTKNPLFQGPIEGMETATLENIGEKETIISAIEDAMAYATANKLNTIQLKALTLNLEGINKVFNPPPLPMASVTNIASGIEGLRRFPKETHKFMGRPLKNKDFSEIDRMVMEGKIPDARGRKWNLKAPETGAFQGWTPSVVPKANIPASKINHQIIADKYGIDVELIRGKDWVEVLEVIRKLGYAHGGRIGYGDGFTVGSNKYNINLTPSASIDILKSSEGDYNIKNKNIMMGLASILNLGPYSAGIDYNKLKGKINVDELGDTVFKEGFDDEMLKYNLGYSKDDLDIDLSSNKDLNEFQLTLRKLLKKKPKYIFKKAQGGLARILEV